jgi:hypothetical protein
MSDTPPPDRTSRYHLAAWMFTGMNVAYVVISFLVLPDIGLDLLEMAGYAAAVLMLSGVFSFFIYRGGRKLTATLTGIYAARSLYAGYTLIAGTAFPIVPWVLPTLLIACYFLARPLWDLP